MRKLPLAIIILAIWGVSFAHADTTGPLVFSSGAPAYSASTTPSQNIVDFSAIVNPILSALGLALAGFLSVVGSRLVTIFEKRTGVQLTETQKDSIRGAANTLGGLLQSEIQRGVLSVDQVHVGSAAVRQLAQAVVPAVGASLAAQGTTIDTFINMGIASLASRLGADPTVDGAPVPVTVTPIVPTPATPENTGPVTGASSSPFSPPT